MESNLQLPINLGLNDGTICPSSCVEVMQQHNTRTSLRNYTTADNIPLLETICELDKVNQDNIFLANGSGPLLKQCVPWIIEQQIRASKTRMTKYLLKKTFKVGPAAFPIISGRLTYFKVPLKAIGVGLNVHLLPLGPETNWKLRLSDVENQLNKGDGLVYICNPNNPTGQLMLERDEIIKLLDNYPNSIFWVDEAYVQYISTEEHQPLSDLVPKYPNLYISRTFSFAYGLAGARIGYLLGPASSIEAFKGQVTNYRLGTLQEALAIAALTDPTHLQELEEVTKKDRDMVGAVLTEFGVEVIPSKTHFILGRFPEGSHTGKWLAEQLQEAGIKIKHFVDVGEEKYPRYFRITLGVGEENTYLCAKLKEILAS
jgi:histidinol-phosphate aminotransferase